MSVMEGNALEDDVDMGPFARCAGRAPDGPRPMATLAVENSTSAWRQNRPFSYIGNANIGAKTNSARDDYL
jgi:bifunctional N-acetylglucosamine-1-phosphate-uridyltransferase/glucosamine-1-phosphate-acetyltransferase GlmU-like protein